MKIINVTFSRLMGGMEKVFVDYTHILESLGHEVISVVQPQSQILHNLQSRRVVKFRCWSRHDPWATWRLRRLILREKPDCILMHNHRTVHICRKTQTIVPKIAVSHVMHGFDYKADAFIAVSMVMRDAMLRFGHPDTKVYYVPNMIKVLDDMDRALNKANDVITIGVCGRLHREKGLNYLIDALAELKQQNIKFKVLIAGDGKQKSEINKLINAYGLQEQVILLGWINDLHSFYQKLDIFCHPSINEAFGLVVLEAMNHHLPMVLTECPGPMEVVGSASGAVFVPIADASALAAGLKKLIEQPELRRELSNYGQKRVQAYSVANGSRCLEHTLNTIIEKWRGHETTI